MKILEKLKSLNYVQLASALVVAYLLFLPAMTLVDIAADKLHKERLTVVKDLKPLDLDIYIDANKELKNPVIQLFRKGEFYCTAFVIGNNYALTAAHCLVDDDYQRTEDEIDIRLLNKATGVKAKAVGVDYRRDLGLIQGDFKEFSRLQVQNQELGIQQKVLACGYPGGNKRPSCNTLVVVAFDGFMLRAVGMLQPGMSGGPVVNPETQEVVAVNCAAWSLRDGGGGGVGISPVLGVLGYFGIEP